MKISDYWHAFVCACRAALVWYRGLIKRMRRGENLTASASGATDDVHAFREKIMAEEMKGLEEAMEKASKHMTEEQKQEMEEQLQKFKETL